jgi:hypothetical protein
MLEYRERFADILLTVSYLSTTGKDTFCKKDGEHP